MTNGRTYLRCHNLTQDNSLKVEISRRLQLANKYYFGGGSLLKPRLISVNFEIKIYTTFIRTIGLYGSETWSLGKTVEVRLDAFERKILSQIYRPYLDAQTGKWIIWRRLEKKGHDDSGGADRKKTARQTAP